ncbi:hypothetical protein BV25DRAFT_325685 [Artomyces pyxidatus]|uniref:Uncharacterized protein n=1 Tax=Artomyces pyxidatus TaxID=48021 RepID=A0ACB8T646_9AGAM|nr:hypothetical protein BV25DRAFT_325685 [Artomyces pyxidatus]
MVVSTARQCELNAGKSLAATRPRLASHVICLHTRRLCVDSWNALRRGAVHNDSRSSCPQRSMSQPSKQPVSGLAKLKRDFSSNAPIKPTVALATSNAPVKRSTISDALRRAIEEGVASREADAKPAASLYPTPLSQKRSLPSQPTDAPPAKRRLPDSWNDTSSSSSTYNYTSSARSLSSTPYDGGSSLSTESKSERKPLVVPAKTLKAVAKPAALFLSAEQKQILQLVKEGKSVFYTGSAGTGKSVLLRNIITTLQKSYARVSDAVAVTASTGLFSLAGQAWLWYRGLQHRWCDDPFLCWYWARYRIRRDTR